MAPLELEILLHYRTRVSDFRDGDFSAPAVRAAIDRFTSLEMLVEGDDKRIYELGDRAVVYLSAVLELPLPVSKWEMPKGVSTRPTKIQA